MKQACVHVSRSFTFPSRSAGGRVGAGERFWKKALLAGAAQLCARHRIPAKSSVHGTWVGYPHTC